MITLPVIAVITPVASLAVGNLLLGESAQLGVLSGAAAALAVLVTSAGVVVLARRTTEHPGPAGGQGSSVTLPAFAPSGSRSGTRPGPVGRAPARRQSSARSRPRPAARQQLATVCIPVIAGGLTAWTFPIIRPRPVTTAARGLPGRNTRRSEWAPGKARGPLIHQDHQAPETALPAA